MGFLKTHPFWTLLILLGVFAVLTYIVFVGPGQGSGGLDLGPIQK